MKTRPSSVDKIRMLHILNETYNGNYEKCAEMENISVATLKKYTNEITDVYETQKDIFDMSKSLKKRIYDETNEIKSLKMEVMRSGHKTIKLAITSLENKLQKDIDGKKDLSAKEVAEVAKMLSEIIKNNEGILDSEANNQATNQFNSVFNVAINQQLNPDKNGNEKHTPKYKWNLPESD